jgi:hypothetical protein
LFAIRQAATIPAGKEIAEYRCSNEEDPKMNLPDREMFQSTAPRRLCQPAASAIGGPATLYVDLRSSGFVSTRAREG